LVHSGEGRQGMARIDGERLTRVGSTCCCAPLRRTAAGRWCSYISLAADGACIASIRSGKPETVTAQEQPVNYGSEDPEVVR
jgi:hypothetical protein